MNKEKAIIGVCTSGREAQLKELLASLSRCERQDRLHVSILIVENLEQPNLRQADLQRHCSYPIILVHESKLGLSHARNRCLDEADNRNADWYISLDDDVTVHEGFLTGYVRAINEHPEKDLFGCVHEFIYEDALSPFVEPPRPRDWQHGKKLRTGNSLVMIPRRVFGRDGAGIRYDMTFNFCGAEDTEYIRAIHFVGLKSCFVSDVIVYEIRRAPRTGLKEHLDLARVRQFANLKIVEKYRGKVFAWIRGFVYLDQYVILGLFSLLLGLIVFPFNRTKALRFIGEAARQYFCLVGTVDYFRGTTFERYPSSA